MPIEADECLLYYLYKQLLLYNNDVVTLILIIVFLFTIFKINVLIPIVFDEINHHHSNVPDLRSGGNIVTKNVYYLTLNIKTIHSLQKTIVIYFST